MPVLRTCRWCCGCLISSWGLNQPHHNNNAALLRGRWHRQKDKNRSPSAKNQYFRNQFIRKRKLKLHHNVGTCLWHVSMQTAIDQYISNKPKEPSLWFVWFARNHFIIRGFFAVKRRAVFILGAKWIALVRGWRRDCVVGGMETRFQ